MNKSVKFWDKRSSEYDQKAKKNEQTYIKAIENTKKHLTSSDTVLEYACGTGIITNEIAGNVKEIHAIDTSSKMIEVAKRKADERKIENINFTQSSIFNERFKQESFDLILAFHILHLLEERQKAIQQINKLLKPGGLFISATPCLGEQKSFLRIVLPLLIKVGIAPYVKSFNISELKDLITNGDFQIIEAESILSAPQNYFIVAKKIEVTQQITRLK